MEENPYPRPKPTDDPLKTYPTGTMDKADHPETICAVATPMGLAGIGIVKISGPDALSIIKAIFVPSRMRETWPSHHLLHGWIRDPSRSVIIDEVLVSYMEAPHSYTAEDVVEINCHSGAAVVDGILRLVRSQGARLAEPGEFTLRAFLNGRIDLSQAEAVVDVIRSTSDRALEAASRHLRGEFSEVVESWRTQLLDMEARLEMALDFIEEDADDVSGSAISGFLESQILPRMRRMIRHYDRGRILKEGLTMVLVGRPNAGKSSLLNALVGRDRAIVTPIPGTTRDVIEDDFWLDGIRIRILDTAGIRKEPDTIESLGIQRTLRSVESADLVVWLMDRSESFSPDEDIILRSVSGKRCVVVLNKADLQERLTPAQVRSRYPEIPWVLVLSVLNPEDVERFLAFLRSEILTKLIRRTDEDFVLNLRQKHCLEKSVEALERAVALSLEGHFLELIVAEIREARKGCERILGKDVDDSLLDRIFSQFCVGK